MTLCALLLAASTAYAFFGGFQKAIPPVSFACGDKVVRTDESADVLERTCERVPNGIRGRVRVRVDPNLDVRIEMASDDEYGECEYAVWLEDNGQGSSPVVADVNLLDASFAGGAPVLRGILGDHVNQYAPYEHDLSRSDRQFRSDEGRATHGNFPYFDLVHGDGGTLIAIGWAGTWRALFSNQGAATLVRAGTINNFRAVLRPGERLRLGRIVLLPYCGRSQDAAMNLWRRWFINRNMPRANAKGDSIRPFSTATFALDTGCPNSDGSISERSSTWRRTLDKLVAERVVPDFRWFDAGWYVAPDGSSPEKLWFETIGTWELDRMKWPGTTFRESNDACHRLGMKVLAWFEPERVADPENLSMRWGYTKEWAVPGRRGFQDIWCNNIGIEACRVWTRDRIVKMMDEHGIDLYREDNNSDPVGAWRRLDGAETELMSAPRFGVSESRFIDAHYRLWDDILAYCAKAGKCTFLDSCASGGGRNDIESLRRAVPFLRSDSDRARLPLRLSMTTSFCRWIPFNGASTKETLSELDPSSGKGSDVYAARASYLPIYNMAEAFVHNDRLDYDLMRRNLAEWKSVSGLLVKDFYPLTPWRHGSVDSVWTAFAYDSPEDGDSVVFVFRQPHAAEDRLVLRLPFVDPKAKYSVLDVDAGVSETRLGESLRRGLEVCLAMPRSSRLIRLAKAVQVQAGASK